MFLYFVTPKLICILHSVVSAHDYDRLQYKYALARYFDYIGWGALNYNGKERQVTAVGQG